MKVLIARFEGNSSVVELPDMTFVDMLVFLVLEGVEEGGCIIYKNWQRRDRKL